MELHKYQKRIVNFIAAHQNCILSVDMGLGKTAATLAYIEWAQPETVCIVAPKRVAENQWHTEAEKWGWNDIARRFAVVKGDKKHREAALADNTRPYKVISRDNVKDVSNRRFDVLVIDELTSFKTPTSSRSKAVTQIRAAKKIGLTGTFLANGAIDVFGQADAVGVKWGRLNFYQWRGTYFRDQMAGSGYAFHKWKLNVSFGETEEDALNRLLAPIKPNIFTLTAADYLDIPPVTHTHHDVALEPETLKAYKELDAFLGFTIGGEIRTVDEAAKFAKLQTLCNGFIYENTEDGDFKYAIRAAHSAKLEAVADFVLDCKEAGEPVLLFYAFVEEAKWLAELLNDRGVKFDTVKRDGFLDRWNTGQTECLFAHPASAGHGLNLQFGGRTIVWSSLTYNYELYAQANARLARQGQKRNVQIHYFHASETCEHKVWLSLMAKDKEQKQFLTLTRQ